MNNPQSVFLLPAFKVVPGTQFFLPYGNIFSRYLFGPIAFYRDKGGC